MPFFNKSAGAVIQGHAQLIDVGGNFTNVNMLPPMDPYHALDPVGDAAYTRPGPVAKCDPGTRLAVIARIKAWVDKCDKGQTICWLNGPAGYGKSALAQSIAEDYGRERRLLGSFFFLHNAGGRSHIHRLIPTLAYQLSHSIPATKSHIEQVLREEPTILSTSIVHQFQRLIVDPIHSASNFLTSLTSKPCILVIDALDECDDKVLMADFINIVIHMAGESFLPFGILFTSRVEEHIRKKFSAPQADLVLL